MALVHDWLNQQGGAENVLAELVCLFPAAVIYTSMYGPDRMPDLYREWDIRTTFMQHLPGILSHHQVYLPIYPVAFRHTDLSRYDLVLSNKSAFCHGVTTQTADHKACHICYCLTPTRFLWRYEQYRAREAIRGAADLVLRPLLARLRRWDWEAAQGVDHFVAISSAVQERILQVYGRESVVVHPPVDIRAFTPDPAGRQGDYYLVVSRLIPYKRIDLAVRAFAHFPQETLLVVGEGRDRRQLEAMGGPNVTFLGRQSQATLVELVRGCKAFLFPGEEDFGIAPVEAMSAGRPVIAFGAGGALDTVISGVTGVHFEAATVESLLSVLEGFDPGAYSPALCRQQASRFSRENFQSKMVETVTRLTGCSGSG